MSASGTGDERTPKMNYPAFDEMVDVIDEFTQHPDREFCDTPFCLRYEGHLGDHFPTQSMVEP